MTKRYSRLYYQKQHNKEVFWQILLPIGIGTAAFLALGIMAGVSLQTGTESAALWGHIAVIWLLLPIFVAGFLSLMFLIGLNFGIIKLIQILPKYSIILLMYIQRFARVIWTSSNKSVQPIMVFRSYTAALKQFWIGMQYIFFGGYNDKLS
jgi:hypothetical protein